MGHRAGKNEHTVHGQREQEEVEVAVISFAHAIPHPWAMMVKAFDAIVANRAM